jgi:hypothetical protein
VSGFITSGLMVGWCGCMWGVNEFCVVCTNLVVASWVVYLVVLGCSLGLGLLVGLG